MKRILLSFAALLLPLLFLTPISAQGVNDFTFRSFTGDYYLRSNESGHPSVSVSEKLVANFENDITNHGIIRSIPHSYQGDSLNIKILDIYNEHNDRYIYETYTEGDFLNIKIGEIDKYVFGEVTYIIDYTMENNILFLENGSQEFYWDINGNGWAQPFDNVTANIHLPAELAQHLDAEQICFAGYYGNQTGDCTITSSETDEQGILVTSSTDNLAEFNTLTVALKFSEETFTKNPWGQIKQNLMVSLAALIPLATLTFSYRKWAKKGKDPKSKTAVIPRYVPAEGFNVLSSDVVLNERLNTKTISAAIIQLAIMGYVRVHEVEKKKLLGKKAEYSFELIKKGDELDEDLKDVLNALFENKGVGDKVEIANEKNKLYKGSQQLIKDMPERMHKRGYLKDIPRKVITKYASRGLVLGVGSAWIFGNVIDNGLLGASAVVSGLIYAGFGVLMPAKTQEGVKMKTYMLGLKDYIEMAEKDRIIFHQSPEGARQYKDINSLETQVHIYEDLLPYAMMFGQEKEWSKQFKDLYQEPPSWVSTNRSNFSAIYLGSMLSSVSASSTAAFTPPSSSGSSSSSGGFSGGFSGGGGGGGGGGGW